MVFRIVFIGFFFIFFFSNCNKSSLDLPYTIYEIHHDGPITDVLFSSPDTGIISSGKLYEKGAILETIDGGQTWTEKVSQDHLISELDYRKGQFYASSATNAVWNRSEQGIWNQQLMPNWDRWQGLGVSPNGGIVTVGGEAFRVGLMHILHPDGTFRGRQQFEHELRDAAFLNDSTIVAVGYGIAMLSTDTGNVWINTPIRGAFFKKLHFPSEHTGYALGQYGTIAKTIDGGRSWKKIRSGSSSIKVESYFTDIHFISSEEGYLIRKSGVFCKTTDGGESWTVINLPQHNWVALSIHLDKAYLVSSDATPIIAIVDL